MIANYLSIGISVSHIKHRPKTANPDRSKVSGNCDTRESQFTMLDAYLFCDEQFIVVLKRDGTNVVTNSACTATSGDWVSPYDGVSTTLARSFDIVSLSHLGLGRFHS